MKPQLLLIPMLLLCACRTTAGTKEKKSETKPYAAEAEILLRKKVGALPEAKAQFYECTLTSSDVPNADEIKSLIAKVPRGVITNVAYHFRAQDPSLEIYAYEKGQPITLKIDYETRAVRDDPASASLISTVDEKCPGPKS